VAGVSLSGAIGSKEAPRAQRAESGVKLVGQGEASDLRAGVREVRPGVREGQRPLPLDRERAAQASAGTTQAPRTPVRSTHPQGNPSPAATTLREWEVSVSWRTFGGAGHGRKSAQAIEEQREVRRLLRALRETLDRLG
jgi:hypothetical protein